MIVFDALILQQTISIEHLAGTDQLDSVNQITGNVKFDF